MTRLVGGVAGGRRLAVPAGRATRPTTERVRAALFSSLGGELIGARVLDLFAGSGALGLEALSRGAQSALLVECHPAALRTLRANVAALGLPGAAVWAGEVMTLLAGDGQAMDVVFLDPPYEQACEPVLAALVERCWLQAGADVVVERSRRAAPLQWPAGLQERNVRRYGETWLWYGRPS